MEYNPPMTQLPREKEVDLHIFVDSKHGDDKWTRISKTWFMIYMNTSLMNWYSKKQSTIDVFIEAVATKKLLRGHIRSDNNPADLLAKVISGQKRKLLVSLVLYDIHDEDI